MPRLRALLACLLVIAATAGAAVPERAPEFRGLEGWLNSPPLTMASLRGKVVLVDFWTYSCINCLRTLPQVIAWDARYRDAGLVVVGVHSPEFAFERDPANVRAAIARFGIRYPVALDGGMATWRAWDNRFWPAKYLVDRDGRVLLHHYGEGRYAETEAAIRAALGLSPATSEAQDKDFAGIASPEMYFGLARVANLANARPLPRLVRRYTLPGSLAMNRFALGGEWKMNGEYAELAGDRGEIRLRFQAGAVHMVAAADEPVELEVRVDGGEPRRVTVREARLYTLFEGTAPGAHLLDIRISGAGLRAFTFTFG